MVLLISSSLCATDIKPASNADGAVHAFFQHQVEEALEAFNVALHHVLIAGHGFRLGEENPEHPAYVVNHQRNTGLFCRFQQAVCQLRGPVGQGFVNTWLRHFGQAGKTRRHGDRVAGERARTVNRAGWCQRFHDVLTTTERADRHAAADDFTRQVRSGSTP